ncbi:MAG: efflux RND transporter periplasmic adaptor subunit [Bacteroidales bacterium]|nr:efflux RND transporter periplasmic adaptor subunit [Bacteroidales bacterium]
MKRLYFLFIPVFIALCCRCSSDPGNKQDPDIKIVQKTSALSDTIAINPEEASDITDYTLLTIKKQPFAFALRTGGQIMVDSRDIIIISAKSSGILKFRDDFLFPGVRTTRGQELFNLAGEQLADDNTELIFSQIKADLEKATANYERAKKLISDKIITEEHFLSLKNDYEKLLNEYNNLNATFGKDGNIISAPANGYIREIYVTEGQKVTSGQPLASIVIEHYLVLKADISPEYLDILFIVESANFTVGYSTRVFKTSEMNGRKISYGKSTGENSYYVPVYFRMNHDPELIEGTFAEVYLIGKEIQDAIVVPNSAIMEEYGKLYVFVADDDGDFIKRYIKTGYNDGEFTQVSSGLSENEKIVSTGAYQIKLSQSATSAPSHNH